MPLAQQRRPRRGVARLHHAEGQLGLRHGRAVGEVDGDPLGCAQRGVAAGRWARGGDPGAPRRAPSGARVLPRPPREHQSPAPRRLAGRSALACGRGGALTWAAGSGVFGSAGSAGTATEVRWPLPSAAWRPGTYSSMTTWKLVPPKPNALTPATRERPGAIPSHGARCSPRTATPSNPGSDSAARN